MKRKSLAEFKELLKGLSDPVELFEMLRVDIREQVDRYFTELIRTELTGFLGRERYERHRGHPTTARVPMSAVSPSRRLDRFRQRYQKGVLGPI